MLLSHFSYLFVLLLLNELEMFLRTVLMLQCIPLIIYSYSVCLLRWQTCSFIGVVVHILYMFFFKSGVNALKMLLFFSLDRMNVVLLITLICALTLVHVREGQAYNKDPCQPNSNNDAYNTFVEKHILPKDFDPNKFDWEKWVKQWCEIPLMKIMLYFNNTGQ